jgi:hypothetical protein
VVLQDPISSPAEQLLTCCSSSPALQVGGGVAAQVGLAGVAR